SDVCSSDLGRRPGPDLPGGLGPDGAGDGHRIRGAGFQFAERRPAHDAGSQAQATGSALMSVPVIEFKQVSVSVPVQGQPVELLRKVSFAVQAGRTLGLVGESGAGKSMIGRVISGMLPSNLRLSSGQVCFQGAPVTGAQMRRLLGRKIAFVPQEPLSSLNPVLTIRQQMMEHLARLGIARRDRERYCLARLHEVGLPDPPSIL